MIWSLSPPVSHRRADNRYRTLVDMGYAPELARSVLVNRAMINAVECDRECFRRGAATQRRQVLAVVDVIFGVAT